MSIDTAQHFFFVFSTASTRQNQLKDKKFLPNVLSKNCCRKLTCHELVLCLCHRIHAGKRDYLQKNLHADENSFTYNIQHTVYYYFSSNLVPKASDKISICMNQHVSTTELGYIL